MTPTTLLVQLSDPHVTRRGECLLGQIDPGAALARAVACIGRLAEPVTAVVVTGDLTAHGETEEYLELQRLLAPLRMPVHLLAGNHDRRTALRAVCSPADASQGEAPLRYATRVGGLRLLVLDTSVPGAPHGELDDAQLQWLAAELERETEVPTVIAMHHPPFATGLAAMDEMGLRRGREQLDAIVRGHPQVERVLCGHLHRSIVRRFGGTLAQTAPGTAHQMELQFDPRRPLGFVLEPPALLLHRWTAEGGLLSHQLPIEAAAGPFPFA